MSNPDPVASEFEPRPRPAVDVARAEAAVREFLLAIGEDPEREGLLETPSRVAKAAHELYSGLWQDPGEVLAKTFAIEHEELIIVRDIPMYSTCDLSPDLTPVLAEFNASYLSAHDRHHTAGLLDHPFNDADRAAAWPVLVWENGVWTKVTGRTDK